MYVVVEETNKYILVHFISYKTVLISETDFLARCELFCSSMFHGQWKYSTFGDPKVLVQTDEWGSEKDDRPTEEFKLLQTEPGR